MFLILPADQNGQFNLIIDTGAVSIWADFNANISAGSTLHSTGNPFFLVYGGGSASGTKYTDTATIGSATVSS
ncbi:hypothetical protein FIBSPDRAFT_851459 [Athelia psychrophila]|uniref:Peptidase A1 domain-containing protein n=1 Tax=Athelia psychrophila TaxID=1759441 RepID=A0A166SHT6_9AGAM|nr:hypothetical protein FIBSPDRAFT_851459 [Fibularhizoctonia sp. CBS 109695]